MRSSVQPNTEWLAKTFADLGVGRRSRQACGPARQLVGSTDPLAMLAWAQALTSQFLQQVVEGLTRWTEAKMKHRSKDWLVFGGQVIHYIAWKRDWQAHHRENYPSLQGDALQRVLLERCLWTRRGCSTGLP